MVLGLVPNMRGDEDRLGDDRASADSNDPQAARTPPADAETEPSGEVRTTRSRPGLTDDSSSAGYEVLIDTGSLPNRGSSGTAPAAEAVEDDDQPTQIAESGGPPPPLQHATLRRKTVTSRGPTHDPRVGQLLAGRYRVERLLAKGGMGRVYLATQLPLERSVAVKVLNSDFQNTDPQFVRRFCLEASISAKLSHPNVVTVHDYGEAESGELFMAMEFLDGRPLSRCVARDGPFPPERTLHVAHQICRALREAHGKGVIHRDLKPGNVMLVSSSEDPDFVKVLDFGLVKLFEKDKRPAVLDASNQNLTRAGTLLGSPRYMSPEQIRGDDLDPRTDIYSLGIILYQLVAGKPPFSGKTSVDVIYKHMNHKVPPLHGPGAAECPPPLETIIRRCLEKNREKRYGSMGEVLQVLSDAQRTITGHSLGTDSIPVAAARSWSVVPGDSIASDSAPSISEVSLPSTASLAMQAPRAVTGRVYEDPASGPHPAANTEGLELAELQRAGSSIDEAEATRAPPASSRLGLLLASLGFVAALIALLVVVQTEPEPPPAPARVVPVKPALPTHAVVTFESTPAGAQVKIGDEILGKTPFDARLPRSDGAPTSFEFVLAGHANTTVMAALTRAQTVQADLEPLPVRPPPPSVAPPAPAPAAKKPRKRTRQRRAQPRGKPAPKSKRTQGAEDERPAYYRDNPY